MVDIYTKAKFWKCALQVNLNKNPAYIREFPIGIINAKDVAFPDDLSSPQASCLIKMTNPDFSSFKLAFQDPESRVRLNSDVPQKYYSCIEHVKITGGYLDNTEIDFSDHLNSVIGGRGTGKSTLLECMRYTFGLRPVGKNAQKQHDEIIKENLGKEKGRVEIKIRSSKMNGKKFIIARRYGENAVVTDDAFNPSSFSISDLLPGIEIYGQNEIYEIAQDQSSQYKLLNRFFDLENRDNEDKIQQSLKQLAENRQKLIDVQDKIEIMEGEVVARLPKLEERVRVFNTLGIEEKLKIVPLLEMEIKPEAERSPVIDFLLDCKLDGIKEGRLSWICEADDFSPGKLSQMIQSGSEALKNVKWGITDIIANAEWIGILETDEKQGKLSREMQGAIDVPFIRDNAAIILEGGKAAFNKRKVKYGF